MKKIISILCIITMIFTLAVSVSAKKDDTPVASVIFEANAPDEDGYFTATLTVKNADFLGFQASLFYDKEAVTPVSFETKEPTVNFADAVRIATKATDLETEDEINWLTGVWTEIHEEGYITFAGYTSIGQPVPNSLLNKEGYVVADNENGLKMYEFSFKKISDKDACFELYQDDRKKEGVLVSLGGRSANSVVTVIQPDEISKIKTEDTYYEYVAPVLVSDESDDSPLTVEQRKLVRARNSIFLNIDNYATVSDGVLKWVDKNDKTVKPYIKDNRTFVPLRFIAEEFGAEVDFDDLTREITIVFEEQTLKMTLGENFFTLDGEKIEMDTACEIRSDRTFVPIRAIAEAFDKSVTWLESDRIVCVNPSNYPWSETNKIELELLTELKLMMSPMVRDYAYMSEAQ